MNFNMNYNIPYETATTATTASSGEIGAIMGALLGIGFMAWIIIIAIAIFTLVARWKVFKKANIDGWEALIPVHSDIVELQLGGVKTYWYFLNLIVICGIGPIILAFWKSIALAKSFGKGTGFGILLTLLPFIGYPILAFGSAQYEGQKKES